MKNKILPVLLSLALTLPVLPAAQAAGESGLDNFTASQSYTEGQFRDVASSSWYSGSVRSACEYGLMKGAGPDTFNPSGNITLAETIALAARLHSIYHGGDGEFTQGSPWYQVYVDYAAENGIISADTYPSYTVPATRADFAVIMADSFPAEALEAVNHITVIPDVAPGTPCISSALQLYNAGILTGSDGYGSFHPQSNISRSEVAAIVTRMAQKSLRKTFDLELPSFNARLTGNHDTLTLSWDEVAGAKGYRLMSGPTAVYDPDTWGQFGLFPVARSRTANLMDFIGQYYEDSPYVCVVAINEDPAYGEWGPGSGVFAQSNVVRLTPEDFKKALPKAEDYAYLAGADFRRVRYEYHSAQALGGYVIVFENNDGDTCALTHISYKIISSYQHVTLHNLTTGDTITDPAEYYQRQAGRAAGLNKIRYIELSQQILMKDIEAMEAITNVWTGKGNTGSGVYVEPSVLNL